MGRGQVADGGGFPTDYPDVNALLATILTGAQEILGEEFVGMYLHGSLAMGDFDLGRSDVDFLVVTAAELPNPVVTALKALHQRIAASALKWRTNYEGSYIPAVALRRYDPAQSMHPAVRVDGSFGLELHGYDWIVQSHVVREHGITLAGPAPDKLIDPIGPDDLRFAVRGTLHEWWRPKLADSAQLPDGEYQAFAVLTMCRILYTLRFGAVVSKPAAARWAQAEIPRWSGLIDQAIAWQHGKTLSALAETRDFIRFTIAEGGITHDVAQP